MSLHRIEEKSSLQNQVLSNVQGKRFSKEYERQYEQYIAKLGKIRYSLRKSIEVNESKQCKTKLTSNEESQIIAPNVQTPLEEQIKQQLEVVSKIIAQITQAKLNQLKLMIKPSLAISYSINSVLSLFSGVDNLISTDLVQDKQIKWSQVQLYLSSPTKFINLLKSFEYIAKNGQVGVQNIQTSKKWIDRSQQQKEIDPNDCYSLRFLNLSQECITLYDLINQKGALVQEDRENDIPQYDVEEHQDQDETQIIEGNDQNRMDLDDNPGTENGDKTQNGKEENQIDEGQEYDNGNDQTEYPKEEKKDQQSNQQPQIVNLSNQEDLKKTPIKKYQAKKIDYTPQKQRKTDQGDKYGKEVSQLKSKIQKNLKQIQKIHGFESILDWSMEREAKQRLISFERQQELEMLQFQKQQFLKEQQIQSQRMRQEHKSLIETKEFTSILRSKASKKFTDTSNDNPDYLAYLSKYASKYNDEISQDLSKDQFIRSLRSECRYIEKQKATIETGFEDFQRRVINTPIGGCQGIPQQYV